MFHDIYDSEQFTTFWEHIHTRHYRSAIEELHAIEGPRAEIAYLLYHVHNLKCAENNCYDPCKALQYLEETVKLGKTDCANDLGKLYLEHIERDGNFERARDVLAEEPNFEALFNLPHRMKDPFVHCIKRLLSVQDALLAEGETELRCCPAFERHSFNKNKPIDYKAALKNLDIRGQWFSKDGLMAIREFLMLDGNPFFEKGDREIVSIVCKELFRGEYPLVSLGINKTDLEKSTYDLGPFYNYLDEDGMPILGDWLPAGKSAHRNGHYYLDSEAYAPLPGILAFNGLKGEPGGTIKWQFTFATDRPALILPEDVKVLMALVFSEKAQPSFNLRNIEVSDISSGTSKRYSKGLSVKEVSPSWLEQTPLGQTLYITDRLMGDIAFSPPFQIHSVDKHNTPDADLPEIAKDFMTSIKEAHNLPISPYSECFVGMCLHVHQNSQPFIKEKDQNDVIRILALEDNPRIRSWIENTIDVREFVNDGQLRHGAIANYMTEHFNELALLLPVYERFRQLLSIYSALEALRDDGGFTLNIDMQNDLDALVQAYKDKNRAEPKSQIVDFIHI